MSSSQLAFLLLVFTGSLLEGEAVLVGFGVLAAAASFPLSPVAIALAGIVGTVVGDQTVYWVGRLSKDATTFRVRGRPVLRAERRRTLERFFERHGKKTVFFLRYAFGLRTVGYLFAGALRMRWRGFALADLAGAATWVSLLVGLGYGIGRPVLRLVREGEGLLLAIPVTAALVAIVIWAQRRFERR